MNNNFGRIYKDNFEYAPDYLTIDSVKVYHPVAALYQERGWYKVVEHHVKLQPHEKEVASTYKLDHLSKTIHIMYKAEKTPAAPRKISKIYLKIALAKMGILTPFIDWLKSMNIDLGEGHSINAYEAFETCLVIDEADPLFAPYIKQAKLAFNLTDQQFDALLDQCIAV